MTPLHLFEAFGIELEYMIVDRETLAVLPVCDQVMREVAGEGASDHEEGPIAWSNELVLHVIELKTNGPAPSLAGLSARFQGSIDHVGRLLQPLGGRLLPTAMHPTMDPLAETRLWPHESGPIYRAYDRIFGCRGHGWSNLQSTHVNLPFHGDEEFRKLHSAIRAVLALLPGLAASSPMVEGTFTGLLDSRLAAYARNQHKVPSIAGRIVPEPVASIAEYQERILGRIYADIAPHDAEGILRHEWLNSRGAIPRFDRDAIEIRLLDIQETPAADLAIAMLITRTLSALVSDRWVSLAELDALETDGLAGLLERCTRTAETTPVEDRALLRAFGFEGRSTTVSGLWRHLRRSLEEAGGERDARLEAALDVILERGTLATRIRASLGEQPSRDAVARVYRSLADCLAQGRMFLG